MGPVACLFIRLRHSSRIRRVKWESMIILGVAILRDRIWVSCLGEGELIVERHLAKIMSAKRALVVSSGMAALDVISRLLKPGDEVIAGDDLYGGTSHQVLWNRC